MSKPLETSSLTEAGNENGEKIPQKSTVKRKGKTPKQVMNTHIRNKQHVITDEEFKELDVTTDLESDTIHEPLEIPENPDHPKDEDKDPKIVTPWDVIS